MMESVLEQEVSFTQQCMQLQNLNIFIARQTFIALIVFFIHFT